MSGWSPAVPRSKAPAANPATASPTCMVCWPPSSVGTVPRADPADVAVTGQAVGRVAPVPDLPGDVAAEDLVPAGLQPFPAQPQPGHQPDPAGGARSEQPSRESRLFDVHRCARRTPIGGASHGATRLLPSSNGTLPLVGNRFLSRRGPVMGRTAGAARDLRPWGPGPDRGSLDGTRSPEPSEGTPPWPICEPAIWGWSCGPRWSPRPRR